MTDDLTLFLRARLADDLTAAARASWDEWDGSHWTAHHREKHDGRWAVIDRADEGVIPTVAPQAADDAGVAQHIARHDPARVLREVEAKGQLLGDHPIERETYPRPMFGGKEVGGPHFPFGCATCHAEPDTGEVHGFGYCLVWKALALPYADHPDYRPEWRP